MLQLQGGIEGGRDRFSHKVALSTRCNPACVLRVERRAERTLGALHRFESYDMTKLTLLEPFGTEYAAM